MTDEGSSQVGAPPFPLGEQTNRAWREQALARVAEIRAIISWFRSMEPDPGTSASASLDAAISGHLDAAFQAARGKSHWWDAKNGAVIERAISNLDAAEALLLRRAPQAYLRGQLPNLWAHIRQHLPPDDPRRVHVQMKILPKKPEDIEANDVEILIQSVRAASAEGRREFTRVRSFRNTLLTTAAIMTFIAVAVAVWGFLRPGDLDVCFRPAGGRICPSGADRPVGTDVFLLEFVGLVSGAVSGSFYLRHMRGTSSRLGLPVALAVLKLPTGALTALLGLLLMRGGFVPGLSNLDSSAQVIAWAVVFGAAQQLVTGLIDRQADTLLQQIRGKGGKDGVVSPAVP